MKKITRTLFAALAVASMAACTQEIEGLVNPSALALDEFGASTETSTKVTIADWKLSWEAGDQVDIYDGTETTVFAAADAGESTVLKAEDQDFARVDDKTYYAVYPSSDANEFDGSEVTLTVAGDRTAVAGQYPSAPAVGVTEGSEANFTFRNVCGLVSFEIDDENITSVVIFGGNNEYVAGTVKVNAETAGYELVSGTGVKEIMLTPAEDETFDTGRYYVAVLPQEFTSGLSVSLYAANGTRLRKNLNAFTLGRSTHVDVETEGDFKTNYTIKNADELVAFLAVADKCAAGTVATLANDIDLSGVTLPSVSSFAGTFDGNGKSLKNWTCNGQTLFETLSGKVTGLNIDASCKITPAVDGVYGVVAQTVDATGSIENCYNGADLTVEVSTHGTTRIGVFAGTNNGLIKSCINDGNVSVTTSEGTGNIFIGGLAADANPAVGEENVSSLTFEDAIGFEGCTNKGDVTYTCNGTTKYIFLSGISSSAATNLHDGSANIDPASITVRCNFKECENTGDVTCTVTNGGSMEDNQGAAGSGNYSNIGGISGFVLGEMKDCVNRGNVSLIVPTNESSACMSRPAVGGVAGFVWRSMSGCENYGSVNVKGTFTAGSTKWAGAGNNANPAVGGVVGQIGPIAGDSSLTLNDSHNYGFIDARMWMASGSGTAMYAGGVVGNSLIKVQECSNNNPLAEPESPVVYVESKGQTLNLGGVAGYCKYSADGLENNADVKFVLKRTTAEGKQLGSNLRAGGVAGYAAADFSSGSNGGAVEIVVENIDGTLGSAYFSAVVGQFGSTTASTSISLSDCTNTGNLTVDLQYEVSGTPSMSIGGVVGYAGAPVSGSAADKLKNSGRVWLKNTEGYPSVGGVIGQSISKYAKIYNDGELKVELSDNVAGPKIGGCVGYMAGTGGDSWVATAINTGAVNVTGGKTATDKVYVGGIVGYSKLSKFHTSGTGWDTSNRNSGSIYVDVPLCVYVGGVLGRNNSNQDASTSAICSSKNGGNITVLQPGENSCIGGVVGYHYKGRVGNANAFGDKSRSIYPTIKVETTASNVNVGGYVGRIDTANGANNSVSMTVGGVGLYGKIDALNTVCGVILGSINLQSNCVKCVRLGTSYSARPKVHADMELNGVKIGSLTDPSEFASTLSTYVGKTTYGSSSASFTYYTYDSADTYSALDSGVFLPGLQNWE